MESSLDANIESVNVKAGDYSAGKLELSTKKTINKFISDVELVESKSLILVTIES